MPVPPLPDPDWSFGATQTLLEPGGEWEPPVGLRDAGFSFGDPLPEGFHNWPLWKLSQWIAYWRNSQTSDLDVTPAVQVNTPSIDTTMSWTFNPADGLRFVVPLRDGQRLTALSIRWSGTVNPPNQQSQLRLRVWDKNENGLIVPNVDFSIPGVGSYTTTVQGITPSYQHPDRTVYAQIENNGVAGSTIGVLKVAAVTDRQPPP